MSLEDSEINVQSIVIEPYVLVDETSSIEYYIGTSRSFKNTNKANWRIKKIWKSGNVWMFGYPDGNQGFGFVWDDRYDFTYS